MSVRNSWKFPAALSISVVILAGCPSASPPVQDVGDAITDTQASDTLLDTLSDVDVPVADVLPVDIGIDDSVADTWVGDSSGEDVLLPDSAEEVFHCADRECGLDPYTGRDCGSCSDGYWCTSDGVCLPDNSHKWSTFDIDFTVDNMDEGRLAFYSPPDGFTYSAGVPEAGDVVESADQVCILGEATDNDIFFVMGGTDDWTIDGSSFRATLVLDLQDNLESLGPDDELMLEWDFYDPTNLYWGTVATIYQDYMAESGFMFELCHYEEPTYDESECFETSLTSVSCDLTVEYHQDSGEVSVSCGDAVLTAVTRTMRNGYVFRFAGYVKDDPDSSVNDTASGRFLACLDTFQYRTSLADMAPPRPGFVGPPSMNGPDVTTSFHRPRRVVPAPSVHRPAACP